MKKNVTLIALFLFVLLTFGGRLAAQPKTKITKADELPRRTVQLNGKALEILNDAAQLATLNAQLIKNLEADLEKYEILDNSTLQGYYLSLMSLSAAKGDYEKALSYLPRVRELESKPAGKLTAGLFLEIWIATKREIADERSEDFKRAFEAKLRERYEKLPYDVIGESVEAARGQMLVQNREVVLGSLEAGLQPVLDNTGGLVPEGVAGQLIAVRFNLDHRFPLNEQSLRVLNALIDANKKTTAAKDIWASRTITFSPSDKLNDVIVAVWDSGSDIAALPAENRFVNRREELNGRDDDGNGFVDDVNGIGYDLINFQKSVGTLDNPAGKIKSDTKRLQQLVKGSLDLQSAIQSPEAAELQRTYAGLKREDVKSFTEELSFYSLYAHGTHVAGIVAEGNPKVKVMAARMSWDYRSLPAVPTVEQSNFKARMYRETVEYFKRSGVRVVNMSWRYNADGIEAALTVNNIGQSPEERRKMARAMFEIEKQALFEAIKNAPEILFVCGSGNENNDADFSEYIPATFDLPNLVTVGAVDGAGRKTSFTTEGKSVDFYANGYEVESFVPGGDRLKFSGTSMASPNVANLAAKLLAVNPQLTPAELSKLIAAGAESSSEDPKIRLINPKKSFSLLKQ